MRQLRSALTASGVDILEDGYLFASLLMPRALARQRERLGRRAADHGVGSWQHPGWLSRLTLTLDAEVLLAARRLGIRIPAFDCVGAVLRSIIVVPCYNEAARLDVAALEHPVSRWLDLGASKLTLRQALRTRPELVRLPRVMQDERRRRQPLRPD